MKTKECQNCYGRGHYLPIDPRNPNRIECTSCNGTGIEGNPRAGCLMAFAFSIPCLWIAYRVAEGLMR